MPNLFNLSLKAQNSYPGNTVIPSATQQVPDLLTSQEDLLSGVFEVFGNSTASANTLATTIGLAVNSVLAGATAVPLSNPITGANLVFNYWRGLYVTVGRRIAGTAPTSTQASATSTTSLLIETGSKAFTVASGLAYVVGQRVRATSAANSANFMEGVIASYSSTTLTVTVDATSGSGTLADWNITGLICAQIKSTGFGGLSTHATIPVPLYEGAAFVLTSPAGLKSAAAQTLTIYLNGTNGLNVNVLVTGT
jgi:hypothetical protein